MKKIALLTAFLTVIQVNYFAQEEVKCAPTLLGNLSTCLTGHGIYTSLIYSSDGASASMFFEGSPNQGHVTSCLVQYNVGRTVCPDAPVILSDSHANYRGIKRN
jgi:hypothetical protein